MTSEALPTAAADLAEYERPRLRYLSARDCDIRGLEIVRSENRWRHLTDSAGYGRVPTRVGSAQDDVGPFAGEGQLVLDEDFDSVQPSLDQVM